MRKPQPSPSFSARLDKADKRLLAELAARLKSTQVDALRLAIRAAHSAHERLTSPFPQAQA
jgi:hypothetical protein